MAEALIQIVDDQDEPIRGGTKKEAWEQGLWHRIVRVIVEDEQGRILLQRRAATKQPYPDHWDNSAAGHVDEGESWEIAGPRELKEELGLEGQHLEELGEYQTSTTWEWRKLNRFVKVYKCTIPADTELTTEGPETISEVRWFSQDEIRSLLADPEGKTTDGLRDVFERYYQD